MRREHSSAMKKRLSGLFFRESRFVSMISELKSASDACSLIRRPDVP